MFLMFSHFWATALQGPDGIGAMETDFMDLAHIARLYAVLFIAGVGLNVWLVTRFSQISELWPWRVRRLMRRPWGWVDIMRVLSVLLVLHVVVLLVTRTVEWLDRWPLEQVSAVWVVLHSVALHWATIGLIWFFACQRNISWRAGFAHKKWSCVDGLWRGVTAYLLVVPYLLFYSGLYYMWLQWTGRDPQPQEVVNIMRDLAPGFLYYYLIALALILAPISEELLFRGLLLPALARRAGTGAAIVASSFLFALIHFHVPSLVPLFVFSVALSLAYIYTRSIVVPIVMHGIFNAISLWAMTQAF